MGWVKTAGWQAGRHNVCKSYILLMFIVLMLSTDKFEHPLTSPFYYYHVMFHNTAQFALCVHQSAVLAFVTNFEFRKHTLFGAGKLL